MKSKSFLSLRSGGGGMDLGLEKAGFKCKGQIEIMKYALKVLKKQWPKIPKYMDVLTFLRSDSPAKTYLKRIAKEKGLKAKEALSSLTVCELSTSLSQLGYLSKMFPDSFQLTTDGTLELSCKRWPKAGMGIRGEFWTVNTSESPNDAKECSLLDVLEKNVHPKYYLSQKAVAGMIKRSKKWGRGGYVFLVLSQQEMEKKEIRLLKRISLNVFHRMISLGQSLHQAEQETLSPKQSKLLQEETLPLYGKTLILRKLTPREKEKLQGFPMDWTLVEE